MERQLPKPIIAAILSSAVQLDCTTFVRWIVSDVAVGSRRSFLFSMIRVQYSARRNGQQIDFPLFRCSSDSSKLSDSFPFFNVFVTLSDAGFRVP